MTSAVFAAGCGSPDPEPESPQPSRSELGTARSALVTSTLLTAVGDTFIRSGFITRNDGSTGRLSVQINSTHRSLLYFDSAAILAAAADKTLLSAEIELTIQSTGTNWGSGRSIAIHPMRQASTEAQATWMCAIDANVSSTQVNCSGANTWSMSGNNGPLPYNPQATATSLITNSQTGVVSFDVTNDVAAIVAGTDAGLGWIVKRVAETTTGSISFASREQGPAPRLRLTLEAPDCTPTASVDAICDGEDEDCDGSVDEDYAPIATSCGVGACAASGTTSCVEGEETDSCEAGEPGDGDATCNGVDEDCDGITDEDYAPLTTSCGIGACSATGSTSCSAGQVSDSCQAGTPASDDAACNGLDDDCDGPVDEDYVSLTTSCGIGACSASGSTSCVLGEALDNCQAGSPAADDATCDASDDDCDGITDEDYAPLTTSCGIGACSVTGSTSCSAGQVSDSCQAGTPASDDAACNGLDDDCDGPVDEDYVSLTTSCGIGACSATGSTSCVLGEALDNCQAGSPAADDATCDASDDDCDGITDEDYAPLTTSCGIGACSATGSTSCSAGQVSDSCQAGTPASDDAACNGLDDDCDGPVDEDYVSLTTSCGIGACSASGSTSCVLGEALDNCQAGSPAADDATCDASDDDCDGIADEDYAPLTTSCGIGACSVTGSTSCSAGQVSDSCQAGTPASDDASCDGLDDDCDAVADEDFAPTCVGTSARTCVNGAFNDVECSDTDACNGAETCSGLAECQAGTAPVVDDGDPCTLDSCDPALGVLHSLLAAGTACGDYRECSADGQCLSLLPPSPAEVAPPLPAESISFLDSVRFIFEGASPIQTQVAPGAVQARTAAVLRGRLLDEAGEPLPGAIVRIHEHPELGQTLTRFDGEYDLVVNGGGPLTLELSHAGYLAAQRTLDVPWQDYVFVDDLALLPPDALSSQLQFPTPLAQVHQAATSDDARGVRTATIYIPSGTDAEMVLADGSSVSMSNLSLRATEFSVGASAALALPAELPPTAAFTYTVELSADEAEAAGAERIEFSQTLSVYLENFLELPIGSVLPVGYYDRAGATWRGLDNGRVIEILAVNAGLAELDVDGSGSAATPEALSALGISAEELETLAQTYAPGAAVWRARVQHLAPFDLSLPYQTDVGLGGTPALAPTSPAVLDSQVLTASLPVTGTALSLRYRSDRVLGHKAAQMLEVPAAGANMSDALLGSFVDIRVAGQRHSFTFDANPDQLAQFIWDGRDGEGRALQGERHVDIRVGSIFPRQSIEASGFQSTFAHMSAAGAAYESEPDVDVRWLRYQSNLRRWDARELSVGAWSIDQHHRFDPVGRALYRGDGAPATQSSSLIIDRFAGITNTALDAGDDGPAIEASLNSPRALAIGPDGALYIGGRLGVRRVDATTGIITTVAGGKDQTRCNPNLQDGLALNMCLFVRKLDFGRDGALYITDNPTASGTFDRIRRLDLATGLISHVAGAANACTNDGDGGPAELTGICNLLSHANGPDGSLYLLDRGAAGVAPRLRKISPNGLIQTIGTGSWLGSDDAGDIAVGPDGSLYVTQPRIIQRILPTGEVQLFAGDPSASGSSGEGGPATLARFGNGGPNGVMVGPDGRVYVGDNGNGQIRMIDQAGIIRRIAGTTPTSPGGNGGPPLLATLGNDVIRTALSLDGTLYVTTRSNHTVRVIRPRVVENLSGEVLVRSDDETETYRFDANGRHLDTVETATGTILHAFGYDSAGRLTSVTSAGQVTEIERDAAGSPTAIVAPNGEETLLDTDENGYLSHAIDPTGAETVLGYDAEGLLVEQLDADGSSHSYSYDAEGRLIAP